MLTAQRHPKELSSFKVPGKRLLGNFDPHVIQSRQKALQDFTRLVLTHAALRDDPAVDSFIYQSRRFVSLFDSRLICLIRYLVVF